MNNVFVNLANCTQQELKEINNLLSNQIEIYSDFFGGYKFLHYTKINDEMIWFSDLENAVKNKTEINFKEFKELINSAG